MTRSKGQQAQRDREIKRRSKGKRAKPVVHHKTRKSKETAVLALLSRPNGATIAAIMEAL